MMVPWWRRRRRLFLIPILTILWSSSSGSRATSRQQPPDLYCGINRNYRNTTWIRIGCMAATVPRRHGRSQLTSLITHKQLIICYGSYAFCCLSYAQKHLEKEKDEANGSINVKIKIKKAAKGTFFGFLAGVITATFGTTVQTAQADCLQCTSRLRL